MTTSSSELGARSTETAFRRWSLRYLERLLGFPRLASPVIVMDQSFCAVIDYVPSLFQGYSRKAPRRMLDLKSFCLLDHTVNLGGSLQGILFASLEKVKGTGPKTGTGHPPKERFVFCRYPLTSNTALKCWILVGVRLILSSEVVRGNPEGAHPAAVQMRSVTSLTPSTRTNLQFLADSVGCLRLPLPPSRL